MGHADEAAFAAPDLAQAATKNAELRKGFDRQTQLTIENSHIVGHDHTVRKRDGAVTNIAYDGKIDGEITFTGTGLRSGTKQPWTYSYEGTVTSDGHAELTGAIFQRSDTSD